MSLVPRAVCLGVGVLLMSQWQIANGESPGFTAAQSSAGRQAYRQHCVKCHGAKLEGLDLSPSLAAGRFDQTWRGKPTGVLFFNLRRMPPMPVAEPGSLGDETYANILAYLLQSNGFAPGEVALPTDAATLGKLTIPQLAGAQSDPDAPTPGAAERSERLKNLPGVTGEMLGNPSPNDWLQWGRTQDGYNYSALALLNRENVAGLKPVWRTPLREGTSMPGPVVHDGIMFLHTFPDTVLALDATNGAILWRHRYDPATASSQKMGVALYDDKVLVPTSDLHVLALNAKTGDAIWDHTIALETGEGFRGRYQLRSAPFVVGDKVIQGVTASFVPRGGFIVALDVKTGAELWRFDTIARPGEPGGETWNDLPLDKRSGGSVWHQGTYDAELNLLYFGVAPTYDTGPLLHSVNKEGISSETLYTNCTIALDADTGKLAWHYQHMANDQWDLDWVFERQIVTMPIDGKPRKVVFNVGKMAILEALDAATGEYLFSIDSGTQNVITAIDPKTGAKTYDPEKLPDPQRPCVICPSAFGARSWPPTSYSPKTKLLYLPLTEWCMGMGQEGFRLLTSGVGLSSAPHPDSADGMLGRIQAVDVENRKMGWTHNLAAPMTTSIVATAGGLLFVGDLDPSLKAFDDTTGELLWKAPLDDLPSASLITYSVDEKQYVAVVVGQTNNHVRDLARSYDEFLASQGKTNNAPPKGGARVWVFAL